MVKTHNIVICIIPTVPIGHRVPISITIFITSALEYHWIVVRKGSLSTDIVPKRQLSPVVIMVFPSPAIRAKTPKKFI